MGTAFPCTKPPLWVLQILGLSVLLPPLDDFWATEMHVVQDLRRDLHTSIMDGEAGW